MSTAARLLERPAVPANPRHDVTFIDTCIVDLLRHWGSYRRLGLLYAAHVPSFERCCMVREAVVWGRKLGFTIEGDRRRGYRVVDFRHPERVYMVKPGTERSDPEDQVPGQMELVCEV